MSDGAFYAYAVKMYKIINKKTEMKTGGINYGYRTEAGNHAGGKEKDH